MKIDIRMDVAKLRRELNAAQQQIPYATALAINELLKVAAPVVQAYIDRTIDRPTPWTRNSYRVLKWAKKTDLTGEVGFKDMENIGGRGTPAGKYLQPEMEGSARQSKGLERLLSARGLISNGEYLVPSKFIKLDQYGNVPKGVVQKMIANLDAGFDRYNNTPSGGARGGKKKAEYFFTRRGVRGARMTAIWQNFGVKGKQHAIPAFIVVRSAPRYKKTFDHVSVVKQYVELNFPVAFEAAYAKAKATAR